MVIIIKAFIRILPLFFLLFLLSLTTKQCQQSACENSQIYCG